MSAKKLRKFLKIHTGIGTVTVPTIPGDIKPQKPSRPRGKEEWGFVQTGTTPHDQLTLGHGQLIDYSLDDPPLIC